MSQYSFTSSRDTFFFFLFFYLSWAFSLLGVNHSYLLNSFFLFIFLSTFIVDPGILGLMLAGPRCKGLLLQTDKTCEEKR